MKKLFFVSFAFDEEKLSGMNVYKSDKFNTYLKNICVSLISAKRTTADVDVALVCNVDVPEEYDTILKNNGVLIFKESFDSFLFKNNYPWCLAFYKLCALGKMIDKGYDYYVYTDADVYVQSSLENVFEELQDNILLYDINHGLGVKDYRIIGDEFVNFGVSKYTTHYGGEFFGASRDNAKDFLSECFSVYEEMLKKDFVTTKGDEFILSVAASRMKTKIKNAGAYIFRFWTGRFYLVSTCYKYNEVSILHLPDEKEKGMLRLYNYFLKKQSFPKKEKVHKICHLSRKSKTVLIKSFLLKISGRNLKSKK